MAITRQQPVVSVDLGGIVSSAIASAVSVRRQHNAEIEAEFQKAVASGEMSYDAQIKFRQDQLAELKESSLTDEESVTSLETSIASLKKLKRFQGIREKYQASLDEYVGGRSSIASHIQLLEQTLTEEQDPEMRDQIRELLSDARKTQSTIEVNAIKNRATVAQKDGSIPLIEKSIQEVQDRRSLAATTGNDDEVAAWDETLIALKTTKAKFRIENAINEISFQTNRYNLKANDKLNLINSQIGVADSGTPITYNGVNYGSEKAFWEDQRSQYIRDSYFKEIETELDEQTKALAAQNKFGQIPVARIDAVSQFYNDLKTRPEFSPFADQIEQKRVTKVNGLVSDLGESVMTEFSASEQTAADVRKAETAVNALEQKFGVQISRLPFENIRKESTIAETITGETAKVGAPAGGAAPSTGALPKSTYTGGSIVDYLSSIGKASDFASRQQLAEQKGIAGYRGTAQQNLQLLDVLRKESQTPTTPPATPTPTPAPAGTPPVVPTVTPPKVTTPTPTPTPTPQPPQTPTPASSAPLPDAAKNYKGVSIIDFLNLAGMETSFESRKKLAQEKLGVANYTGTAEQNTQLLKNLRGY